MARWSGLSGGIQETPFAVGPYYTAYVSPCGAPTPCALERHLGVHARIGSGWGFAPSKALQRRALAAAPQRGHPTTPHGTLVKSGFWDSRRMAAGRLVARTLL